MSEIVKLESCDGVVIEVERDVAIMSKTLQNTIETCDFDGVPIPVGPNIESATLTKIMDWCRAHRGEEHKPKEDHEDQRVELSQADDEYMDVDDDFLVKILTGADFLNIQGLIDIITQKIALMIKGKNPEQIREIYCLDDDLTPEEKEEIRKKYEWVEA